MIKTNLLEYFEETVQRTPEKTAMIDGSRQISFDGLAHDAKLLAVRLLRDYRGHHNRPIGVFLPKSIESVTADLGIIYSGNAYMNLDIKTPIQRIRNIISLVEPLSIITDGQYQEVLETVWPTEKILLIHESVPEVSEKENQLLFDNLKQRIDTDPLCLINTSGSTGTPKSVVLNHRSFIDFTEWAIETTGISNNEIVGSLSPIVFDIYSFELCMLMAKSATLVVIPDSLAAFPVKILQLMRENNVSFIFWVPTIMVNIANMNLLAKISTPALRTVWFAGEVFPTRQFNYWRRMLPEARMINLYGPIEITLDCTYFIADHEIPDEVPLPIGFPCHNSDVFLLNERDELADINEEGEICVRGSSLALGYYNNPEKTAAAFVQNPLNRSYPETIYRTGDLAYLNERGEMMFKGRKDSLVKHSGYRIDLGEIEHVIINTLHLVKNGCVVYHHAKKEIVFFYEAPEKMDLGELRRRIGEALPKYMIPNRFVFMDELPRNTNGKIDRLHLKNKVELL